MHVNLTKLWCSGYIVSTRTTEKIMSEIKDYTSSETDEGNTHYNGVSSFYGRIVEEQNREQPQYCEPGTAGGEMRGEKRNEQAGP